MAYPVNVPGSCDLLKLEIEGLENDFLLRLMASERVVRLEKVAEKLEKVVVEQTKEQS